MKRFILHLLVLTTILCMLCCLSTCKENNKIESTVSDIDLIHDNKENTTYSNADGKEVLSVVTKV